MDILDLHGLGKFGAVDKQHERRLTFHVECAIDLSVAAAIFRVECPRGPKKLYRYSAWNNGSDMSRKRGRISGTY